LLQGFQGLMLHFQAVTKQLGNPELARASMERTLSQGDEVMREGRMRVRDLRAEGITGEDFAESLAEFGQNLVQVSSTLFALIVVGNQRPLNPVVQDEVFQVMREAITNAFAHAHASKVEVEVTYGRSKFKARVRDNGCGITKDILDNGRAGHWGLFTMRERAKKIGAELRIESNARAGSEITLSMPVTLAYHDNRLSRWAMIKGAVRRLRGLQ
jgi:signal transduction histidine kinase